MGAAAVGSRVTESKQGPGGFAELEAHEGAVSGSKERVGRMGSGGWDRTYLVCVCVHVRPSMQSHSGRVCQAAQSPVMQRFLGARKEGVEQDMPASHASCSCFSVPSF